MTAPERPLVAAPRTDRIQLVAFVALCAITFVLAVTALVVPGPWIQPTVTWLGVLWAGWGLGAWLT